MRRRLLAVMAAATIALTGCGGNDDDASTVTEPDAMNHGETSDGGEAGPEVAADVAAIRAGTAAYVNDVEAALDDGYFVITQHIEDMGSHVLNPEIEGFDIGRPPILVYGDDGEDAVLAAVEWVFPEEPDTPPIEGATYGAFPAACHYEDGLFVPEEDEDGCSERHAESDASFTFWHPDLVTLHVWAWLQNPDGIFNGTNPLMSVYNE